MYVWYGIPFFSACRRAKARSASGTRSEITGAAVFDFDAAIRASNFALVRI